MGFDEVIEIISEDERTFSVPVLFIVQVVSVMMDLFRLENKDEQLSLPEQ